MTHKDWQEYEEYNIVRPIVEELGLSHDSVLSADKPDIRLSLGDAHYVGIEVTQYIATNNKRADQAVSDLFLEYNDHLRTITDIEYQVSVMFRNLEYPTQKHIKKYKEQIFREIDSFLPGSIPLSNTSFVEEACFYPSPGVPNFTGILAVFENIDVDEKNLFATIKVKERKLLQYKQDGLNKDLEEYWLAIYFATEEKTDFWDYQLPKGFHSTFDRIYLVELTNCKRIL